MIKIKIIADTHCHAVGSCHAYSTIMENVSEAKAKGLYAIAITDHARTMPSPPGTWYFENFRIVPNEIKGVKVLRGVEANLLGPEGNLDIPFLRDKPDFNWVIASIHKPAFKGPSDIDSCTQAWLNVAKNPAVNVIGHSGSPDFMYDYEKVIPEFKKHNKLVEINNNSFLIREGSKINCKRIAELCKKYEAFIVVNSDAHFCTKVGCVEEALQMLDEINFPEELVVNSSVERFEKYLRENTNFFETYS